MSLSKRTSHRKKIIDRIKATFCRVGIYEDVRVSQKLAPQKFKLPLRSALGRRCVESGSDIAVAAIKNRLLIAIGDEDSKQTKCRVKILIESGIHFATTVKNNSLNQMSKKL
jgi:hypothetical protein